MDLTKEETTLSGVVDTIIFQNEGNGWTVLELRTEQKHVTVVGSLPYITEGDSVQVYGDWTYHSEYGEQFKAVAYEKTSPKTREAILKYLSSGVIRGVGPATAKRIVERFGSRTLDIIEGDYTRLAEVKGISPKRAEEIHASYAEKQAMQSVVLFLQQYGVPMSACAKIYRQYGALAVGMLQDDPYVLCREVYGIGFQTADKLALSLGKAKNDSRRVAAGLGYALSRFAQNKGYTYVLREELLAAALRELEVDREDAEAGLAQLLVNKEAVEETLEDGTVAVYPRDLYEAQEYVAQKLALMCGNDTLFDENEVDELILSCEYDAGVHLADNQKKAVRNALLHQVSVITGGPGTGKTTIINILIQILEKKRLHVLLTAPTGRAAKRMSDICIREAKTIHRLLEVGFQEGEQVQVFGRNEENKLSCDVLIVDEMSMVDLRLMEALLRAIKGRTQLVLVGDADQLPSVGPGNVLCDIIRSGRVPSTFLNEIFRQAQRSLIVVNAHRINGGEMPLINQREGDFFLVSEASSAQIAQTIVELCQSRIPKAYGKALLEGVQVLSPMRKGEAGVRNLNRALQQALNPPEPNKPEKRVGETVYRVGDKVMQIKNNYDIEYKRVPDGIPGTGVFNGDSGVILEIDRDREILTVLFDDDRQADYSFGQLDELEHAYAVTIHKSQGSEYRAVVLALFKGPEMLFTRNLLYTAVTRARELVILVGTQEALARMVQNNREIKRNSRLADKLKGVIPHGF